jgi:hypothetical protein
MENPLMDMIVLSLKKMISYCIEMQELLKKDAAHFAMNEVSVLEENNKRKAEVIEKLNIAVKELNTSYPIESLQNLLQSKNHTPQHDVLKNALESLRAEIGICNKHLAVNNHIVRSNMEYIKEIWSQVVSFKAELNLYDNKGLTVK